MSADDLKVIADLTLRLTELKLKEVPHLCIENFAPEIFGKLIAFVRADVKYGFLEETTRS